MRKNRPPRPRLGLPVHDDVFRRLELNMGRNWKQAKTEVRPAHPLTQQCRPDPVVDAIQRDPNEAGDEHHASEVYCHHEGNAADVSHGYSRSFAFVDYATVR
jgi:hypothetical protein